MEGRSSLTAFSEHSELAFHQSFMVWGSVCQKPPLRLGGPFEVCSTAPVPARCWQPCWLNRTALGLQGRNKMSAWAQGKVAGGSEGWLQNLRVLEFA